MTRRAALWLMLIAVAGIFYGVPCSLMETWWSTPLALAVVFCGALVVGYVETMLPGLLIGPHRCRECDKRQLRINALEYQVVCLVDHAGWIARDPQ